MVLARSDSFRRKLMKIRQGMKKAGKQKTAKKLGRAIRMESFKQRSVFRISEGLTYGVIGGIAATHFDLSRRLGKRIPQRPRKRRN